MFQRATNPGVACIEQVVLSVRFKECIVVRVSVPVDLNNVVGIILDKRALDKGNKLLVFLRRDRHCDFIRHILGACEGDVHAARRRQKKRVGRGRQLEIVPSFRFEKEAFIAPSKSDVSLV